MQELSVLLTLAAVFAVALVSPGPDVALAVRTSLHQAAGRPGQARWGWPAGFSCIPPWC